MKGVIDGFLVREGIDRETIRLLYEDQQLNFHQVAGRLGVSPWYIYRLMRLYEIPRRRGSEQNYVAYKNKPQFALKAKLTAEEEQLRIAGVMLYRAEGTKTGHVVDFTNSDPLLVNVFMSFLRRVCGVGESRIRIFLYCYADQDVDELKRFWSRVTGVPIAQFTKPFVRALTPNVSQRKMKSGLVHVRYSDKRLLQLILTWSEEYAKIWAGA